MAYDETNKGVGFPSSAFTGKVNFDGNEYQLAIVGAGDKAKFKYLVFVYNRDEVYQTVLFSKDKKTDNSPNYSGSITLPSGTKYWLNVWHKKSDKGNYFMSVAVKNADKPVGDNTSFADTMKNTGIDDEIPF